MSARTEIAWTDATWNPVRGCSRVSDGCRHCYAEALAAVQALAGMAHLQRDSDGVRALALCVTVDLYLRRLPPATFTPQILPRGTLTPTPRPV